MNEYIKKETAESADYLGVIDYNFYAKAHEWSKEDVEEENGEWIPYPEIPTDIFRCTKCGVYIKLPEKIDRMYYNFCPNCGKRNVNIEHDIDNAK